MARPSLPQYPYPLQSRARLALGLANLRESAKLEQGSSRAGVCRASKREEQPLGLVTRRG